MVGDFLVYATSIVSDRLSAPSLAGRQVKRRRMLVR